MPRISRPLHILPIAVREIEVAKVEDVSPSMRRMTFTSDEFFNASRDGHQIPDFASLGFDDHVKLIINDGSDPDFFMGVQEAHNFKWNPEIFAFTRSYSVRSWDATNGQLVIDIVRHDDGLVANWAETAKVGDTVHIAGPKSCAELNLEVDWHLLVGDETALPAIGRWLEEAPEGTKARIFVEVPAKDDIQQIETSADAEITWLVRGDDYSPGHSPLLVDAVTSFTPLPGRGFAWVAGEAMTLKPIRRHLRSLLPVEDLEIVGYWRRVEASQDDAPASEQDVLSKAHHDVDLAPALILRTAISLGVCSAIAETGSTSDQVAAHLSLDPARLRPLLDALVALGYVQCHDGVYRNTSLGEVLTEDFSQAFAMNSPLTRAELALMHLPRAIRNGTPSSYSVTRTHHRPGDLPALDAYAEERMVYLVDPLAKLPEVASAKSVVVIGEATVNIAAAIAPQAEQVTCMLKEAAKPIALRKVGRLPNPVRHRIRLIGECSPLPKADCYILSSLAVEMDDKELTNLVNRIASETSQIVLLSEVSDSSIEDDHAAARALQWLANTGVPLRTTNELEQLVSHLGNTRSEPLGWGFSLHAICVEVK